MFLVESPTANFKNLSRLRQLTLTQLRNTDLVRPSQTWENDRGTLEGCRLTLIMNLVSTVNMFGARITSNKSSISGGNEFSQSKPIPQ